MDLSIRPDEPPATRSQPREVPLSRASSTSNLRRTRGGWLDVSFGYAKSAADLTTFAYLGQLYSEPFALAAAYPAPGRGAEFDVGAGYMFTPVFGVSVGFTGAAHKDIAGLGATVPHPYYYNAATTASGATEERLSRTEGGIDLQAMIRDCPDPELSRPTVRRAQYLRYRADMVQDIEVSQSATVWSRTNSVAIGGYTAVIAEGTGWGGHAGADATYFFSRVVGIGAVARYAYGKVTTLEPLSETNQEIVVGGLRVGGGLRLRFWSCPRGFDPGGRRRAGRQKWTPTFTPNSLVAFTGS